VEHIAVPPRPGGRRADCCRLPSQYQLSGAVGPVNAARLATDFPERRTLGVGRADCFYIEVASDIDGIKDGMNACAQKVAQLRNIRDFRIVGIKK
jgi:hypothetical protein